MEKDLYFKVLKHLIAQGLFNMVNISSVFDKSFLVANIHNGDLIGYNGRLDKIIELLTEMQENKHIVFIDHSVKVYENIEDQKKWIKPVVIDAKITALGLVFYRDNKQTILNNMFSRTALGMSFIALVFTGRTIFNKPDEPPVKTNKQILIYKKESPQKPLTKKSNPKIMSSDSSRKY